MSTLILSLAPGALQPSSELRYVLSVDGHHAARSGSCPAHLLPDTGRAGEVVAVVPQQLLSWQRVTLPQGTLSQMQRLRAILEGLLEEQVLDDPALLHFALAPEAGTGTPIWVAVCDRAWLQDALQTLEATGHRVDRVVPQWAPGPTASGRVECTVIGTPEAAHAVLAGVGAEHAVTLLPLGATALANTLEPDSVVRAEPAVVALAEQTLDRPVGVQPLEDAMLAAARGTWNLAQFDLANTGRQRALRWLGSGATALLRAPEWRAARWALVLLVLVQVVALNLWAWQDGRALAQQQAAIRGALTQTFSQVRLVVDAPVQMQREVALLRQQAGGMTAGDLEPLLAAASALPEGQTPTRIDYADGQLRLRGLTLDAAQHSAFDERLAAQNLKASAEGDALLVRPAHGGTP